MGQGGQKYIVTFTCQSFEAAVAQKIWDYNCSNYEAHD